MDPASLCTQQEPTCIIILGVGGFSENSVGEMAPKITACIAVLSVQFSCSIQNPSYNHQSEGANIWIYINHLLDKININISWYLLLLQVDGIYKVKSDLSSYFSQLKNVPAEQKF